MKKRAIHFSLFNVALILFYTLLNIIGLLYHEPWRDEAQAWLIARDLDVISMFKQMAYEGTPGLWHLILFTCSKLGFSYTSQFIIHLLIAITIVGIFLFYSPFSKLTKLLFIFSYYISYEYSILARSYSTSILLLFLIASIYHKRFKRPIIYSFLIFLLFNTNVHSFFIGIPLAIAFIYEFLKSKNINKSNIAVSVSIIFLGVFLLFLQLSQPGYNNYNKEIFSEFNYLAPFGAIKNAFFPWQSTYRYIMPTIISVFISSFILVLAILFVIKKPIPLFILCMSYLGLFYVFIFKNGGSYRQHGFILVMIFFVIWIGKNGTVPIFQRRAHSEAGSGLSLLFLIALNFCLFLSVIYCSIIYYKEYKYTFSGAREMAYFIKENAFDDYTIVSHPSSFSSALLPYLPGKKFFYADTEEYGTFISWNKRYIESNSKNITDIDIINLAKKQFINNKKVLLLLNKPLEKPNIYGLNLLHKVDKQQVLWYIEEKFYLYGYK